MSSAQVHPTTSIATPQVLSLAQTPAIPSYLQTVYWWAYIDPRAVKLFEREWLVNLILFGNYSRLRDMALCKLSQHGQTHLIAGKTLQIACVYGNLTAQLIQRMTSSASLKVVDVVPVQLENLARKITPDPRVALETCDSTALPYGDAQFDQALLFFLLHEQPEASRRQTLREAIRVLKPGGRLVITDYHRPHPWHPLRPLMKWVFRHLEPFAMDLWHKPLTDYLPRHATVSHITHSTCFGGLYQILEITRAEQSQDST